LRHCPQTGDGCIKAAGAFVSGAAGSTWLTIFPLSSCALKSDGATSRPSEKLRRGRGCIPGMVRGENPGALPPPSQYPRAHCTGSVRSLAVKLPSAKRDHTPAGSGAVRIEHDCHSWCDCWKGWLPFVHWRPWNDPPEAEIQHWAENPQPHGLLSDYLTKLQWEHRQTEPQKPGEFYKDWRSVQYFPLPHLGRTVDRVYMWPQGVLNVPRTGPRMQQEQRYVKAWWQFFRKSVESQKPQKGALSDVICSPSGKIPTRISVDVAYAIVKKDPCAEEVPYYQKHDSDEDVAAFFNCSRATAFRRIKGGFRIPEELRTVTTAPLATTAHRLNLGVLAGGGYMKMTPAVEIPRGSTESRPGDR
jgi:hypothetical protein